MNDLIVRTLEQNEEVITYVTEPSTFPGTQAIQRRKTHINERLTPCQFCEYPISERHHGVPISPYGENECILYLCANCHELYHIVQQVFLYKSARAAKLLGAFKKAYGAEDVRLRSIYHFIAAAANIIGNKTI